MPNKIIPVSSYSIKSDDVFFFDNNIWMYLFCPIGSHKQKLQNVYSNFFQYVVSRKNPIFVNAMVLSEFANRYLKLDYDLKGGSAKYPNFKKDYMGSADCRATVGAIKKALTDIVRFTVRGNDDFNAVNLTDIFSLFQTIGFNDSYYLYLASKRNWKIVSNDSDFTRSKIPDVNAVILTAFT